MNVYPRVYVEITNICNLNCSFCHGHSRPPRQLSREEFSWILDALEGKTGCLYYHLMGEPLTHPQLPEFLTMARSRGFRSVITTNGTLLHKQGKALLEAGVHKVSISLHSFEKDDPQGHENYMSRIADFIDEAAAYGTVICLRLWNQGFDGGQNAHTEAFLRSRFPEPWTKNTRGYRLRDKVFLEWGQRFSWPDKSAPIQSEQVYCLALRDHFGILCDGTVVPCCLDSEGAIPLGNVFREDLKKILASPRAQAMAKGFQCRTPTEDLCRRCGFAQRFTRKEI